MAKAICSACKIAFTTTPANGLSPRSRSPFTTLARIQGPQSGRSPHRAPTSHRHLGSQLALGWSAMVSGWPLVDAARDDADVMELCGLNRRFAVRHALICGTSECSPQGAAPARVREDS